jgi:SPP1 family predicted phage head-tail adaptor
MIETDAGRLNRLLVIKSKGQTLNSLGEPNHSTLSEYTSLWGSVSVASAAEKFVADSDHPFQVVLFKTRYRPDITDDMVIEYDGYRYDIEGIKRLGHRRKKHMLITAIRD